MKAQLHHNLRAYRDQIRAEELNHEARTTIRESLSLEFDSPRVESESRVEPFGFNPFMGLAIE
jgi:hypothetical protein